MIVKKYCMEKKEIVCELYLHNMVIPISPSLDPNAHVGGVQLLAFSS